jgi:hypothetical protein
MVQLQPGKSALGVLLIAPIYRHGLPRNASVAERRVNLVGVATGVFRIDDMLEAALTSDGFRETWVRLSDGDGTLMEPTLFDGRPKNAPASGAAERTLMMPIAGRRGCSSSGRPRRTAPRAGPGSRGACSRPDLSSPGSSARCFSW